MLYKTVMDQHHSLTLCVLLDGYAYYEEWTNLVQKSDQQVKELLETFGSKCKDLEVRENFFCKLVSI